VRINDVEQFHHAIVDNDLDRFAGRPKDVDDLFILQTYGRFGSLTEMDGITTSTKSWKRQNPDRINSDPLSKEQARLGA